MLMLIMQSGWLIYYYSFNSFWRCWRYPVKLNNWGSAFVGRKERWLKIKFDSFIDLNKSDISIFFCLTKLLANGFLKHFCSFSAGLFPHHRALHWSGGSAARSKVQWCSNCLPASVTCPSVSTVSERHRLPSNPSPRPPLRHGRQPQPCHTFERS